MRIPKRHAVREILCSKVNFPTWLFFQWNEFGPSAGLTAGLGSVRAKLLYNFNLFYWGPFLPKIHENEQIGVYCADELTNYMQTMM